MNRSLLETGGTLGVVSQFTLLGDARKGRRPSFVEAAPPERGRAAGRGGGGAARARGVPRGHGPLPRAHGGGARERGPGHAAARHASGASEAAARVAAARRALRSVDECRRSRRRRGAVQPDGLPHHESEHACKLRSRRSAGRSVARSRSCSRRLRWRWRAAGARRGRRRPGSASACALGNLRLRPGQADLRAVRRARRRARPTRSRPATEVASRSSMPSVRGDYVDHARAPDRREELEFVGRPLARGRPRGDDQAARGDGSAASSPAPARRGRAAVAARRRPAC